MNPILQTKWFRCGAALLAGIFLLAGGALQTHADAGHPAATPPMGWNSYDAFGDSVTEAEVLANAQYLKKYLIRHGWQYVVVDYRWYDPGAYNNDPNSRKGAPLTMDEYGRLLPATNRFPSAMTGAGFKPLADQIHGLGLKFGIHVMRGIPRLAVKANLPIEGSGARAWDASSFSLCPWNPDMFGVDAKTAAGTAYYDSILRLYASWGVDFIKVDDLSRPYSKAEIEAIRSAIDKCGRPITFSTSPGETPRSEADHIAAHANMWRVSDDFWDDWKYLDHAFDLAYTWQGVGGPGHWPDSDMIPLGRIGIRSVGRDRRTKFTREEQMTLMSFWCLTPSPLMLGMNLPDNDDATLSLLTNDEALAINQDPLGKPARRAAKSGKTEVWVKELGDGSLAAGLFNRSNEPETITLAWTEAGLKGQQMLHDVWSHKDLGVFAGGYSAEAPAHGSILLKATAAK